MSIGNIRKCRLNHKAIGIYIYIYIKVLWFRPKAFYVLHIHVVKLTFTIFTTGEGG